MLYEINRNPGYPQPAPTRVMESEEAELDLRAIFSLLRRRIWLILATIILVVGIAALVTLALKPAYTASTLVLVDTSKKDLLANTDQSASSATDSARVDSEVELVKSEATLLRVIRDQDLVHDPDFAYRVGWRDRLLAFLKLKPITIPDSDALLKIMLAQLEDAVRVQRRGLTYIIAIDAKAANPAEAAKLSNAVASAYIQQQLEAKVNSTLASRDVIEQRIPDANSAVVSSEGALDNFYSDSIPSIANSTGNAQLTTLANQLANSNAEKLRVASLLDSVNKAAGSGDWDSVTNGLRDQTLAALNDQRKALERNLASTPTGPLEVNLRDQLSKINSQLSDAANKQVSVLQQQVSDDESKLNGLRGQIGETLKSVSLPPDIVAHLYTLQENQRIATDKYQSLLARRNDLDVNAYLQVPDSRIVSPASPPSEPSFPNTKLILALAAVAAVGLGVGLAFIYENYIGGFTSEQQLESVLGAAVVTAVPRQKGKNASGASLADLLVTSPLSIYSESIRRIRVRLDLAARNLGMMSPRDAGRGTIVMITSTAPNEGKTTMSLSLARAYALSGKTTLLIDCDLRKPSVHRHLNLDSSAGLVDYLTLGARGPDLKSFAIADPLSPVQVALGGRRSNMATDQLITNSTFSRLLEAAASVFDVVVLDTPPVGPVVDGVYLAQYADVIAFVVQAGQTSQQDAKKAVRAIAAGMRDNVELLLILNQYDENRSAYYYKYRGYYTE